MQAAFVTPYLPWPADTGGKLRSHYLLKGLALQAEVDLYTVSYAPPTDPGPLAELCRSVTTVPLLYNVAAARLRNLLATRIPRSVSYFRTPESLRDLHAMLSRTYDLVISDEIVMSPYVLEGPAAGVPSLIIRHKIDYQHYAETAAARPVGRDKALDWIESRRLRTWEYAEMPRFSSAVVCSEDDRREAQRQGGPAMPIEVIVNGADTDFFQPVRTPAVHPTVLIMGTMHYFPNIDAVLYYFQTMHDALRAAIPDLRVLIVGHMPPPELVALGSLPGVTVTGSVPDVRTYMQRSWVQIVPLRLGGGTRLKIVESMAAGLPVISTTVGAQGLAVHDGDEMLLADDPADYVRKVAWLLNEEQERERMALRARGFVEERYSWQGLGRQFATFCSDTVESARVRKLVR